MPSKRRVFAVRVAVTTPAIIEEIAASHGCWSTA